MTGYTRSNILYIRTVNSEGCMCTHMQTHFYQQKRTFHMGTVFVLKQKRFIFKKVSLIQPLLPVLFLTAGSVIQKTGLQY